MCDPAWSHTFMEIDNVIFFYGHSPPDLLLIQEGLVSVTSESIYTKMCHLDMTIAVDWERKFSGLILNSEF